MCFGFGNLAHIAKLTANPDLYYDFLECGLMSLYDVQNINQLLTTVANLDPSTLEIPQVDPEKEAEAFSQIKIPYEKSKIPMGKRGNGL